MCVCVMVYLHMCDYKQADNLSYLTGIYSHTYTVQHQNGRQVLNPRLTATPEERPTARSSGPDFSHIVLIKPICNGRWCPLYRGSRRNIHDLIYIRHTHPWPVHVKSASWLTNKFITHKNINLYVYGTLC